MATPKKKVAVKKTTPKKAVAKKPNDKKLASKKTATTKKPAKKAAKPAAKKVAPKKATAKKSLPVVKNTNVRSTHKEKAPVVQMTDHKKELKKALKNAIKKTEPKKNEKPFVMPKTSTERSRKYEPPFVKSILDQTPEENHGPTMRYSDAELNEFKDLITKKLESAKKELAYLQGLITRKDEMGGDETDNRYMTMEDGSLSMEREQLSQMASRQITYIDHLEKALMRIENKTYGICRVTGKLIDKARLKAVPHATLSIEAKMGIAK